MQDYNYCTCILYPWWTTVCRTTTIPVSCILMISVSRYLVYNGMQDYNYLCPVSNILMSSVSRYLVDNGMQDYNYMCPVS